MLEKGCSCTRIWLCGSGSMYFFKNDRSCASICEGLTATGSFTNSCVPNIMSHLPWGNLCIKNLVLMVLNEIKSEKLKSEFLFQSCRMPVTRSLSESL